MVAPLLTHRNERETLADIPVRNLSSTPAGPSMSTDCVASIDPAPAATGAAADPTYAVVLHERMRQLINSLVAEAAGDLQVREYRDARYLLRPGFSLEHQFFAPLTPGVAKLKIQGFRQQWGATEVEVSDQYAVLFVPLTASFWQRVLRIRPGLKIQIGIPQAAAAVSVSEVRVFIEPVGYDRKMALTLSEETAPQLLESLRTFFQAQPERRGQARLPFEKAVQIIPVLDDCTKGDAVFRAPRHFRSRQKFTCPVNPARDRSTCCCLAGRPTTRQVCPPRLCERRRARTAVMKWDYDF